jgi:hypothetical protein
MLIYNHVHACAATYQTSLLHIVSKIVTVILYCYTAAPLYHMYQDILAGTRAVGRSTGVDKVAAKAKTRVNDKLEDVAEAWETSQHPLVYRASSVWDS